MLMLSDLRLDPRDEDDLIWFFTEAEGEMGIRSNHEPILYLILFGQAFNLGKLLGNIPGLTPEEAAMAAFQGAPNYFSFFSVGMVGFVAVTATLFTGANVIFDKLFGVMKRVAGSPAPPAAFAANNGQ